MIVAREVNGARQNYKYDKKGQLLGVCDGKGNVVEEYVYDPAGNILKKTIQGRTTTYKYDKANQLVSSECNGKVTKYEYDAAGRLVKEGDKVYSYIGLDKIESVTENGRRLSSFSYHIDGQLAEAVTPEKREFFQWDGLALIQRNSTNYVNEPAVTGGNPILADDKVLFNDMLGTTLGIKDGDKVMQNSLTAFGESLSTSPMQDSFFTGKPHVGELGYAFLFRNYRADQGKWQTSDPLGYPDGWNNFAYVNNWTTYAIDRFGQDVYVMVSSQAVYGVGHSAVIIGNATNGYSYYSHGSGSGFSTEYGTGYSSYEEALAALQNTRTSQGKPIYDDGLQATTTPEQDAAAKQWAEAHKNDIYNPVPPANQCMTYAMGVLDAANVGYTLPDNSIYGPFEGCTPKEFMTANIFRKNFRWMKGVLE